MRAHFGKLNGEIELREGMNLLVLPNEGGKSTWSAFLLAMLYGIDTSERAKKENGNLPAKERYRPWDGGAPEGSVELVWNGRNITIERRSSKSAPMSIFRAYDTDTGAEIPELTGENCGLMLCGVERSVFERSAFIRQLGLGVSADPALEKRLGALVAAGEEGAKSYSELDAALRARQNEYQYRNTGKLPRLQAEFDEKKRALASLEREQEALPALRAQTQEESSEVSRLVALEARVQRAHEAKRRKTVAEVEESLRLQRENCRALREKCAALPSEATLKATAQRLEAAADAFQTAQLDAAVGAGEAPKPEISPIFQAESLENARAQVEKDAALVRSAETLKSPARVAAIVPICVLLAAAVALFATLGAAFGIAALALAALCAAVLLPIWKKKDAAYRAAQAQRQQILSRYGAQSEAELFGRLREYERQTEVYERALSAHRAQKEALTLEVSRAKQELGAILSSLNAETVAEGRKLLSEALESHANLSSCERELAAEERRLAALRESLDLSAPSEADEEALAYDPAQLRREKEAAQERLRALSAQLSFRQGALAAQGDVVCLKAQLEALAARISEAQEALTSIALARAVLQEADQTMRSRFSPQIAGEAGAILTELTEGKYGNLTLSPDMSLSVREAQGVVSRPAAAMSCGTADQMYLALRLAMCRKLLGAQVPLILDDALVNFDAARTVAALRVLRKEAETRQILLFSCRKLEE